MKLKILFLTCSVLLILVYSCSKDDGPSNEIEIEPCSPIYSKKSAYMAPKDYVDVDQDGSADFFIYIENSSYPSPPGKPGYEHYFLNIATKQARDTRHKLITKGYSTDEGQKWFRKGMVIFKDSIYPDQHTSDGHYGIRDGEYPQLLIGSCGGQYLSSWKLYEKDFWKHDVIGIDGQVYMAIYDERNGDLGWIKLALDVEKGVLEFVDHKYGSDSLVVIGE